VIGIGYGQHVLVPSFRSDPRCEVVAIAASTPSRAERIAEQIGVRHAFGDWRDLVHSPNVDAVAISVPPASQPEMAIEGIQCGKPVLCEKPLANSLVAAERLAEVAANSGVPNMVDFLFPEVPLWGKAKEILDGGGIGNIRQVDLSWSVETYANKEGLDSWKTRAEDGGGALNNFFSQCFHYLEWFLGPVGRVSANSINAPGDTRAGETAVSMTLEFMSGIFATASLNTAAPMVHRHCLMFHGDDGTLKLENNTKDYVEGFRLHHGSRDSGVMQEIFSNDPPQSVAIPIADGRVQAATKIIGRLLDWTQSGESATPNIQHGLRVQSLLEAARISSKSGKWTRIAPSHHQGI